MELQLNRTEKTVAIIFIIAAAVIIYYNYYKKNKETSSFVSCRPGTCPMTRADGSIFCTAAACSKTKSGMMAAGL